VKALVLAKFILIGRALHLGHRLRGQPLIWPTLYYALTFPVFLVVLTTIKELLLGLLHHRDLADSLGHVVGSTSLQVIAAWLAIYLILIPPRRFQVVVATPWSRRLR
jgi:hypothetical protein